MDTQVESASYLAPKLSRESSGRRRKNRDALLTFLLPLLTLVAVVILWDGAIVLFEIPSEVIPRPMDAVSVWWDGMRSGVFIWHTFVTLQEVIYGFVIGTAGGFVVGVLVAEFRYVRMAVFPFLIVLQITPKVAIAPLFIIWLGYGIESKVAIAASISFFPVVINTIAGLQATDSETLEMMKAFCATRFQVFKRVKLKLALPYIFAGLNVAMALAVIGAIVAEFVGSTKGLGYLILQANFKLDTAQVFAVLFMLAGLGIALNTVLQLVSRRALFWHDSERAKRA
jgi:NitT/TauT family transport system permease protein